MFVNFDRLARSWFMVDKVHRKKRDMSRGSLNGREKRIRTQLAFEIYTMRCLIIGIRTNENHYHSSWYEGGISYKRVQHIYIDKYNAKVYTYTYCSIYLYILFQYSILITLFSFISVLFLIFVVFRLKWNLNLSCISNKSKKKKYFNTIYFYKK